MADQYTPAPAPSKTECNTLNTQVQGLAEQIGNIFSDVDFTLLYSYFPSDIVAVVSAVIAVLLFLAILDHFLFLLNFRFCLLHSIKLHCGLQKNDLNLGINLGSI